MQDLNALTRAELLDIYNQHATKPLKGFKDHATAVARTTAILAGDTNAEDEAETIAGDEPEANLSSEKATRNRSADSASWSDAEWEARAKKRGWNSVELFRAYRATKTELRRTEKSGGDLTELKATITRLKKEDNVA